MRLTATTLVLSLILAGSVQTATAAPIITNHDAADAFGDIPTTYFQSVRDHYRFFYGHTSHGSQICTGIDMLAVQNPSLWADVTMTEVTADLGFYGDLAWAATTRTYLNAHPECNAVLWSWCGGQSSNTPAGVDAYLHAMNQLESDYPGVLFVYMTGHLDGTGPTGVLYQNNDRIRAWCTANGKVLFDFADIESVNPDGVYYPNDNDACAWCSAWTVSHTCPSCADCAHSNCFNCYRKGQAFWWMMARASGWQSGQLGVTPGPVAALTVRTRPNPFGHATTLAFSLAEPGVVRLRIVDAAGRFVATLADAQLAAGPHEFTWAGRTANGDLAPAGIYFAHLTGNGTERTERLVLLR